MSTLSFTLLASSWYYLELTANATQIARRRRASVAGEQQGDRIAGCALDDRGTRISREAEWLSVVPNDFDRIIENRNSRVRLRPIVNLNAVHMGCRHDAGRDTGRPSRFGYRHTGRGRTEDCRIVRNAEHLVYADQLRVGHASDCRVKQINP